MKQLLEAGVHFGHQTSRWNPKMKPYIFGARNGIYIIDLQQTVRMFVETCSAVKNIAAMGGVVLFVGTKRQAQDAITEEATRCSMSYVRNRWLGGTLTNFPTIRTGIERLKKLEEMLVDENLANSFTKKEILKLRREKEKLEYHLGGIKSLKRVPDVLFVIDPKKEEIAVREARKLSIPVAAVIDTNCDPDLIDYKIPGNDDAIRAIKLFCSAIAEAVIEGKSLYEESQRSSPAKEGSGGEKPATGGDPANVIMNEGGA
jgi:small subunit ribosomal protein S2